MALVMYFTDPLEPQLVCSGVENMFLYIETSLKSYSCKKVRNLAHRGAQWAKFLTFLQE